jgi:Flp pilus assembly protein TadG
MIVRGRLSRDAAESDQDGAGRDRGMFTAEFAAGLPALIVLLFFGVGLVAAISTRMQCLDAAREGALAAARGDSGNAAAARVGPPGSRIGISESGDSVTATVSARIRMFGGSLPVVTINETAVAAREPTAAIP